MCLEVVTPICCGWNRSMTWETSIMCLHVSLIVELIGGLEVVILLDTCTIAVTPVSVVWTESHGWALTIKLLLVITSPSNWTGCAGCVTLYGWRIKIGGEHNEIVILWDVSLQSIMLRQEANKFVRWFVIGDLIGLDWVVLKHFFE